MLKNNSFMLAAFGFACVALVMPARAALLLNGSFELSTDQSAKQPAGSTAIDGWVTTLDGVEYFKPADFFANGFARDGQWIVDLAYVTSSESGGIEQTVGLTPSQEYELTFSLGTLQANGRLGTAEIELVIDGQVVQTYNIQNFSTDYLYEDLAYTFTATNASMTIGFQNQQNANLHFAYVDFVDLQEVPEPASGMLLLGLLTLASRRWRRSMIA